MTNSNKLSRMPSNDKKQSRQKDSSKRILKKGGNGGKDDDSSIDSHGNIRDLIDYDYTSDDESVTTVSTPSRARSPRPQRKAAIIARKKIDKYIKKEN